MKLLDIYEDLFQYICRLHRMAKAHADPGFARARSDVKDLLNQISRNATSDVHLSNQVARLELPIVFFIDNVISTGRFKFATQWAEKRLAHERNERTGDERFFVDFLEKDLTDTSEEAEERLAVYYACLGLGFRGMYQSQPEKIRWYMEQIFPRIRQWMDVDPRTKVTEEAYRFTDTQRLTEPPSNKLIYVAIGFVFLSLSFLFIYYGFYANAVDQVTHSVRTIIDAEKIGEGDTR